MNRRTAMLLSGAITAFALMVVVGLVYGANQFNSTAAAAASPAALAATSGGSAQANSADAAALQQQVQTLKAQLQTAYNDLQTAYNQIAQLQQSQGATGGRFRSDRRGSSSQSPFGSQQAPFFGGDD